MVYYKEARPTEHYLQNHKWQMAWDDVLYIMFIMKTPRKKGNKFEIKTRDYYILFEVKNKIAYVINAKRL